MSVKLTAAEARRLGVVPSDTGPARRTTRKQVTGKYVPLRCQCGYVTVSGADEDRHNTLTHVRFELVL